MANFKAVPAWIQNREIWVLKGAKNASQLLDDISFQNYCQLFIHEL